jgi:serine protease Do
LGISVITIAEEVAPGLQGLLVDDVTPGGAGDAAGIQKGDYLLSADGEELLTSTDLLRVRRHHYLGETMEIVLWRSGEQLQVTLHLTQSVED